MPPEMIVTVAEITQQQKALLTGVELRPDNMFGPFDFGGKSYITGAEVDLCVNTDVSWVNNLAKTTIDFVPAQIPT